MERGNFLYRSETSLHPGSAAAEQILVKARRRNAAEGLTGFLHHEEGFFFQWLEGPEDSLARVGAIIEADRRHSALTYLHRGRGERIQFPVWRMGYSDREDGSLLDWLACHPVTQIERAEYARSILEFLKQRSLGAQS